MEASEDKLIAWLRLARTSGVGPVLGSRLVRECGGVEEIFAASPGALRAVEGMRKDTLASLMDAAVGEEARRDLDYCREHRISVLALDDPGYPSLLREIYDPPLLLYARGEWRDDDGEGVAVVGTRNPDAYGESMASSLGSGLARYGVTVVSGMARGIDGMAQGAALKAGGRSVAVLGTGVDVVYPAEHRSLYEALIERGAVLSEYPPGTGPAPGNFPRRNRLVVGLSRGVVMVQAMSDRSGALITVRLAVEQGREVFAVPGNAGSRGGRVGNRLIKDGARLVETADDVVLHLRPLGSVDLGQEGPREPARESGFGLRDSQARVYALVPSPAEGAIEVADLVRQSGAPVAEVQGTLLELELAGLVRPLPGNKYVRLIDGP